MFVIKRGSQRKQRRQACGQTVSDADKSLSIWNVNHFSQSLNTNTLEALILAEFQLSLGGKRASWYNKFDLNHFATFQMLKAELLEWFCKESHPQELVIKFYNSKHQNLLY